MNLVELYKQTLVERHKDIKVIGERVFVRNAEALAFNTFSFDRKGNAVITV